MHSNKYICIKGKVLFYNEKAAHKIQVIEPVARENSFSK